MKVDYTFLYWLLVLAMGTVPLYLVSGAVNHTLFLFVLIIVMSWAIYSKIGINK